MPFFGFLGGAVLATLVVVLLAEQRRRRAVGRSLDWLQLPWPAYALALAYAALFVAMWAYYFDGDFTRMKADLPDAELFHILRGYLFQFESGDFVVTLLAFLCGGLAIAVLARSGNVRGGTAAADGAMPKAANAESGLDGIGTAALRQMRRITALNTLLVFALFLFTLPALLPWIEQRLSVVKLGEFEAHLVPLADKSRGSSTQDTPSLYAKEHLGRWLSISSSISRTIKVIQAAPDLVDSDSSKIKILIDGYKETRGAFEEKFLPRIARLYCMSVLAGVEPAEVPGVREASSALMMALQNHVENEVSATTSAFRDTLRHLGAIDVYYSKYYSHLSAKCIKEISSSFPQLTINTNLTLSSTRLENRRTIQSATLTCLTERSRRRCDTVLTNGYTIRLATELAKVSGGRESDNIQLKIVEAGWLNLEKYDKYTMSAIDRLNLQIVKIGYMTSLNYQSSDLIREYIYAKDIAQEIIDAISKSCNACSVGRKSNSDMRDEFDIYRRNAVWYMDADAVAQIGAAMLRRLCANKLDATDQDALRMLLNSASGSRDEIHRGLRQVREPMAARDRWAAAILDEGIATIRYAQLLESTDISRDEQFSICVSARARLEGAVRAYDKLSVTAPEHRFNQLRAERTLTLVNQYCRES
jgi:hypothetical protein